MINPFQATACAAGLTEPRLAVDLVLASRRRPDEGAPVARGLFLDTPGSYLFHRLDDDWSG